MILTRLCIPTKNFMLRNTPFRVKTKGGHWFGSLDRAVIYASAFLFRISNKRPTLAMITITQYERYVSWLVWLNDIPIDQMCSGIVHDANAQETTRVVQCNDFAFRERSWVRNLMTWSVTLEVEWFVSCRFKMETCSILKYFNKRSVKFQSISDFIFSPPFCIMCSTQFSLTRI